MEYFIIENNGQQAGPFSLEQLVQKAITPETLVWAQDMKDWTPAWKIAELKTVLETVEAIKANANKENAEGTSADAAGNNGTEAANFQAANQQAQQEAYQQGFQHGAAMNQGYRQESEEALGLSGVLVDRDGDSNIKIGFRELRRDGTAAESTDYGKPNTFFRGLTTQGWTVTEADENGYVIMRYNLAYTENGKAAKDMAFDVLNGFRIDFAGGNETNEITIEYVKSI